MYGIIVNPLPMPGEPLLPVDSFAPVADATSIFLQLTSRGGGGELISPSRIFAVADSEGRSSMQDMFPRDMPSENLRHYDWNESPLSTVVEIVSGVVKRDKAASFVIVESSRIVWDDWLPRKCLEDAALVGMANSAVVAMGVRPAGFGGDIIVTGRDRRGGGIHAKVLTKGCDPGDIRRYLKGNSSSIYLNSGIYVCSGRFLLDAARGKGFEITPAFRFGDMLRTFVENKKLVVYPLDYYEIVKRGLSVYRRAAGAMYAGIITGHTPIDMLVRMLKLYEGSRTMTAERLGRSVSTISGLITGAKPGTELAEFKNVKGRGGREIISNEALAALLDEYDGIQLEVSRQTGIKQSTINRRVVRATGDNPLVRHKGRPRHRTKGSRDLRNRNT